MLEDMRKYVQAGLEALSSQGADDASGAIISKFSGLAEQFSAFAAGFLDWSAEARASLLQEVRDLVGRQIDAMGVPTKDDLEALRSRIDALEARGARGTAAKRASTSRSPGSRKAASRKRSTTAKSRSSASSSSRSRATSGSSRSTRSSGSSRSTRSSASSRSRPSEPGPG